MAKIYPRGNYSARTVARTDAIAALMEQCGMDAVMASKALNNQLSAVELLSYRTTPEQVRALALASVRNTQIARGMQP